MAWRARLPLFLAVVAPLAAAQSSMICCQDPTTGRRLCADSLPEQCRGQSYKLIDRAGNVIKEVGPPLTPEQKAAKEAEARRQKEEAEALKERRRRDQALLDTYSSLADIESARARAQAEVVETIHAAEAKIAEARKQRKKYENEAEFYKKKALPPEVDKGLKNADYDIRAQTELLDAKTREMGLIKEKYDEDRKRYLELTGGIRRPSDNGYASGTSTSRPR